MYCLKRLFRARLRDLRLGASAGGVQREYIYPGGGAFSLPYALYTHAKSPLLIRQKRQLLLPRHPLDPVFPTHSLFPGGKSLKINQLHRPSALRIFCPFSLIVCPNALFQIICPPCIQRVITAFHNIRKIIIHLFVSRLCRGFAANRKTLFILKQSTKNRTLPILKKLRSV